MTGAEALAWITDVTTVRGFPSQRKNVLLLGRSSVGPSPPLQTRLCRVGTAIVPAPGRGGRGFLGRGAQDPPPETVGTV